MKFLIATDAAKQGFQTEAKQLTAADFGGVLEALYFEKGEGFLHVSSSPPASVAGERIFWDGGVIDRDIAFSAQDPIDSGPYRIGTYLDQVKDGHMPVGLAGVFCGVRASDGNALFATDPVSQYAVFYRTIGTRSFFSNCLHLLERLLAAEGYPASRGFASNAFELAFGAGGWTRTGLDGVHKIPAHHFAEISAGRVQFRPFPVDVFRQGDAADYDAHLQMAADSLMTSAAAIAARYADGGMMVDLSGGKDTRLILASLLASGQRDFQVFLGGGADSEDREIATRLVRHLGLSQGSYLSNLGQESLSATAVARRSAYRFEGTSSLFQAVPGVQRLHGVAQVRGGSSEAKTRSFYRLSNRWRARGVIGGFKALTSSTWRQRPHAGARFKADVSGSMNDPLHALPFLLSSRGGRVHHLFKRSFLRSAYDSFVGDLNWLSSLGIVSANLAEAYYLFDRGWRHCGFPTQIMNSFRSVFEPLNDISLLSAQTALGPTDRDDARVARDLFDTFDVPDLLAMPFEGGDWPAVLTPEQQARRLLLARIKAEPLVPDASFFQSPGGHADSIYSMGGEAYMRAVQPYFLDLARDLPIMSDVWNFLHRDRVVNAIAKGQFAHQRFAHDGVRLLHGLIWMSQDEMRP